MQESSVLLSAIIQVIHLQLFQMGMEAMHHLGSHTDLSDVLKLWYSIFNGVSVISNQETPTHQDNFSQCQWYDLLTTVRPYVEAILKLLGVRLKFKYASGTVVGLCGRILRHGVSVADRE
jgi:hypothetical protein